ncbi:hypothetical protein ACFXPN_05145 [Streptomyces griseorubiginosus]|uniref:hypothetical protein n=1 Tax=Streptomyces griseorubiginosus TaxID=67304 RepID=UPI0036C11EFA
MNPGQNEDRVFARLERRLVQDDPVLAATMAALNDQFSDDVTAPCPADGPDDGPRPRSRRLTVAVVCTAIAILGLILTALLNSDPRQADDDPQPVRGLGVSTCAERRFAPRTTPRRRCPGHGTGMPRGDLATGDRRTAARDCAPAELRPAERAREARPAGAPEPGASPARAPRPPGRWAMRHRRAHRCRRPPWSSGVRPRRRAPSGGERR